MKTAAACCVTAILTAATTLAIAVRADDDQPRPAAASSNDVYTPPPGAPHPLNAGGIYKSAAAVAAPNSVLLAIDEAPARPRPADGKPAADDAEDAPEPTREEMFRQIATILKQKGTTKDDVLTITIPRDDLIVTVEGQDVPVAAGIESQFRFYQCPCGGKISVVGSFVTADYEANDVIDALREGHLVVASVGPFLTYENPKLTMVRFQGEAKADEMGNILKKALEWTGEQRGKPRKVIEEKD